MKILKLEFRNINSLRGFHEIDFTKAPFTGSTLFAITGPTGSGKSSILDVISLALFNKIPRLDKVSKSEILKTGAIITRNQQDAMAAVTYEGRGGSYRSEWNISTARTGSLREYNMQLSRTDNEELFDLKKSEVPDKNEELIGLNYNQFIKSVLLAQGEFAQFLKARKEERGELLEKITGTGIYRQLGRLAWEKHKEVNVQIVLQQQAIGLLRTKLLEPAKNQEFQKSLKEKEEICAPLELVIEKLKKQLQLKESLRKSEVEIAKLELEKMQALKGLKEFSEKHGQPLLQHEKLRPYSEELRQWNRLQEESAELNKELEARKTEEAKNLLDLRKCIEATAQFTNTEISADNILQNLVRFREKVSALQEERRQKLEVHSSIKSRLEATLSEVEFPWLQEPQRRQAWLQESSHTSKTRLKEFQERLQVDLENLSEEKQKLRLRLENSRKAQLEWVQLEQLSSDILRLKKESSEIEAQTSQLPPKKERLVQEVAVSKISLENLQLKKENQLLLLNLEDLRRKLKDGEACQLCGSLEHPYCEGLPEMNDEIEEEIKEATEKWRELSHQLSSVSAILEGYSKRHQEIKSALLQKEEKLQADQGTFNALYSIWRPDGQESWQTLCKRLEAHLIDLESCEREQRVYKAVAASIPLHKELENVLNAGKKLKLKLEEFYKGTNLHSDCEKLQNNWLKFSQNQEGLKKLQQDMILKLEQKQRDLKELEIQLQPVLSLGFGSIADARRALLPEPHYQQLSQQQEQLKSQLASRETSLKLLTSQLEGLKLEDGKETSEELQENLRTRNLQLQTVKQDCEDLRRLLRNDADHHNEIRELQTSIADQERKIRRWRLLNELIGDAVGKKFNDFAQDLSLSQLIHLANARLKDLSDRYRIDKPGEGEDDGLVAIDEHMGGQRRSVKTLSGGETFLLSLSMALALSDLASKNVEINSLFIDEGFGTLDPETLDQTLDTLEKLQAESSKTIGIISHVDSLKERIATQVQLKRNGQGYSQLQVTG